MKLSQCTISLAVLAAQGASALTGPEYPRVLLSSSLLRRRNANAAKSLLHTSLSTMNILGEEEDDASCTASKDENSPTGPLSASTVTGTVTPFSSSSSTTTTIADEEVDWDWEELAASVFAGVDQRPVVLFDGVCNLCNGGVNFAMDQDETAKLRFCSLQSKTAQSLLIRAGQKPTDMNKIVLVASEDRAYFGSDAVMRICQQLDAAPLQWIGTMGREAPEWMRETIYQFVSKHRYQFGESDSCRLDFDGTYTSRFISDPVDLAEV